MRRIVARLLSAAALGIVVASTASAADLPAKVLYSPAPAYSWTGFYAGVNLGYSSANGGVKGVIGGGQLGYNWQSGNFVYGLETDFQGSGQKGSATASSAGVTLTETEKLSWFGTTRARLGFAANNWLFYGTGGVAYGNIKIDGTSTGLLTGPYSASVTKTGWAAGAGIEAGLWQNWTARIEYLYVTLPSFSQTYVLTGGSVLVNYDRTKDNIVRAALNYRF